MVEHHQHIHPYSAQYHNLSKQISDFCSSCACFPSALKLKFQGFTDDIMPSFENNALKMPQLTMVLSW